MTSTIVEGSLEIIEHLDFEECCDSWAYKYPQCDSTPNYKCVRACCGAFELLCTDCLLSNIKSVSNDKIITNCKFCGNLRPDKPYSSVEPYKKNHD